MSRFFAKNLQSLVPYTPGEQPVGICNLIKLNTNESPFAPSQLVKKAIDASQIDDLRLYSDPTCNEFLTTLATIYNVKQTQVIASNGSDEILAFAFRAFCENGAAFANITYGFYHVFAQLYNLPYNQIALNSDFTISVEAYENEKGTVFIANPNAPTGIALGLDKIEQLLCQNPNRLLVVDEAYVDFGAESAVSLIEKYDNLLVVGTFSKSRSLAGARLGFAIGNEQLIKDLNTVKFSFNPYNVNRLTLIAGTESLKDKAYFKQCCEKIISTREYTKTQLESLSFTVTNSKTNFLFAAPPQPLTGEEYYKALRQTGIIVRYFNQNCIDNYVRITIGTSEQMEKLLQATKLILNSKK